MYSTSGCSYCEMAVGFLRQKNIEFLEHKLDVNFTKEFLLEKYPTAKTFPVIIVDGYHIGGYKELREHVSSQQNNQQLLNERVIL